MNTTSSPQATQQHRWGLPFPLIAGLALLAAPRAVLHDLHIIEEGSFVTLLLAVVPLVVWIGVTVRARVPHPFLTLLATGACYGVLLALIHQLLWNQAFSGSPPVIGGSFSELDLGARQAITRVFSTFSSLFTGAAVGAVVGLVGWAISTAVRRRAQVW